MVTRGGVTVLCLECNATQQQSTEDEMRDGLQNPADPSGLYNYRYGYYKSYGYHPFYGGVYYDDYYGDYDIRSFDQDEVDDIYDDEESATTFGDS